MSTPASRKFDPREPQDLLIGALLRVPAQAIHRRIVQGLNAAGFDDLRLPHIAVFLYPGPDGERPTALAERAGISKQAMNQLLKSLEGLGYVSRSDGKDQGRARVVGLSKRGHAVFWKILDILQEVEQEWRAELGPKDFAQLKKLLGKVWGKPFLAANERK